VDNKETGLPPEEVFAIETTAETMINAELPSVPSMLHHPIEVICTSNQVDIQSITYQILQHKTHIEYSYLEIGRLLKVVKNELEHGKWLNWLDGVDISVRTAQRLIRLANHFTNASPVSHLGFAKAEIFLRLPKEEQDNFLTESHKINGSMKNVVEMSKRELEKVVRDYNKKEKIPSIYKFNENLSQMPMRKDSVNQPKLVFDNKLKVVHNGVVDVLKFLAEFKDSPGTCDDFSSKLLEMCEEAVKVIKREEWKSYHGNVNKT